MTGNHPGRSGNPARRANPGLDQLAAQIRNDRAGRNPLIVELEPLEQQLLEVFVRTGGEQVAPEQAGAAVLILGQLFADLVPKLPMAQQQNAPAIIINLMRMAGQRLYSGDLPGAPAEPEPEPELRCPFVLPHGAPCRFSPRASMGGTLTTVMQGHVALHHPGEIWPPADEEETLERAQLKTCDTCAIPVDLEGDDPLIPGLTPGVITHTGVQCIRCARGTIPPHGDEDEPYSEFHAANFPAEHGDQAAADDGDTASAGLLPRDCPECGRGLGSEDGHMCYDCAMQAELEAAELRAKNGGELVFDPELLAAADNAAAAPAELVCEGCLRPVVLATVDDEQLLAFRFEAHGDGAVLCVECIAALPTPTRETIEQIIRDETFMREHVELARRAAAGQLPAARPALTLPALGQCPTCHRPVPLETVTAVASHMIEGTALQCTGTGLEPVEALPIEPSPWAPPGPRTFHPDGTVTHHEQLPTPWQCPHPKHARMHLPGGARCSACGQRLVAVDLGALGCVDEAETAEQTPVILASDGVWPDLPPGATFTEVRIVDDPEPVPGHVAPRIELRRDADGRPVEFTAEVPSHLEAALTTVTEADRGSISLSPNRPQGHVRIEPGFDAHGNLAELSVVTEDGQRAQVIPPAGTLFGADGQPIRPDNEPGDIDGA